MFLGRHKNLKQLLSCSGTCTCRNIDLRSSVRAIGPADNPVDIGTRAINIEELKRNEWLNGPAWLKRTKSEWPEQVNLVFASDEENIPSAVFNIQAEEKKAVVQWERFSNFNRLLNTEPVKEGTADTKDAREYDEVHRRAVRSGNAVE